MGKSSSNTKIVAGRGDPCPRCKQSTQIREHVSITEKELSKAFYYSRWFCCMNSSCKTKLIMPTRYIASDRQESQSMVELKKDVPLYSGEAPPWDP